VQNHKIKHSENKLTGIMQNSIYHNETLSKTEQFLQECAGWIRLLDFFKQENSHLKTRLSLLVDHTSETDFLPSAEQFQNQFILKDELITEIIQDVKKQEIILSDFVIKKLSAEEKLVKKQQKLRNEIEFLEKDFSADKHQFNKFISSML